MKKHFLLILTCVLFATADAAAQDQSATVGFKTNRHDFGTVDKRTNEFIETTFELTNPGKTPLIIYRVDVSCGCLTPEFTKEPILQGKTGRVKLRLDVKQLGERFNKTAFVKTNAPGKDNGVLLLRVTGKVK